MSKDVSKTMELEEDGIKIPVFVESSSYIPERPIDEELRAAALSFGKITLINPDHENSEFLGLYLHLEKSEEHDATLRVAIVPKDQRQKRKIEALLGDIPGKRGVLQDFSRGVTEFIDIQTGIQGVTEAVGMYVSTTCFPPFVDERPKEKQVAELSQQLVGLFEALGSSDIFGDEKSRDALLKVARNIVEGKYKSMPSLQGDPKGIAEGKTGMGGR